VCVIEGNAAPAAKLKISGGGKCNITNTSVDAANFLGDELFIKSVLGQFGKEELLEWLEDAGLSPVVRKGRYYFCPGSSDEIIGILRRKSSKSRYFLSRKIISVEKDDKFTVITDKGELRGKKVIVATGGASFKALGASDIGLKIARGFSHEVKEFQPALAGLTLQPDQFWMKELSGISLPVRIKVGGRVLDEDLLFAHRGISGPVVLSASLYWSKGLLNIDFLPNRDIVKLCRGQKKLLSTAMQLPKRFAKQFLKALSLEDKPCNKLSDKEKQQLSRLHDYAFAPSGTFGFAKAEVSRGGVLSMQLKQNSCESTLAGGLYFIGEVVDVTGELGGYNLQWAFSSGVAAADDIVKKECYHNK
ncbi:MAG: hypothetical protein B5M52_00330, partial [Helicobacteraceae bacterium 4484_230]